MLTIILLSIAGAVIAAVVGTFWYSPITPMGRLHMRYLGFDRLSPEEQKIKMLEAKPKMPKLYLGQMVLSLLTSAFVVSVVTVSVQNGVDFAMAIAFPVLGWLCFTVPSIGTSIIWGTCDPAIAWPKFFSDSLSVLVTILLIALMTGLFL